MAGDRGLAGLLAAVLGHAQPVLLRLLHCSLGLWRQVLDQESEGVATGACLLGIGVRSIDGGQALEPLLDCGGHAGRPVQLTRGLERAQLLDALGEDVEHQVIVEACRQDVEAQRLDPELDRVQRVAR